jgi:hypothetical protein
MLEALFPAAGGKTAHDPVKVSHFVAFEQDGNGYGLLKKLLRCDGILDRGK